MRPCEPLGLVRKLACIRSQEWRTRSCGRMGRPKIYEEKRITTAVRIPEGLHAELKAAARDRALGMNALAVLAMQDYLRRLVRVEELVR